MAVFLAAGGAAIVGGLSAAEIAAIGASITAITGIAYLSIRTPPPRMPTGGIMAPKPNTPNEIPGAVKIPENPTESLIKNKYPFIISPYRNEPKLKNPEAEVKKLPDKVISQEQSQKPKLTERLSSRFNSFKERTKALFGRVFSGITNPLKSRLTSFRARISQKIAEIRKGSVNIGKWNIHSTKSEPFGVSHGGKRVIAINRPHRGRYNFWHFNSGKVFTKIDHQPVKRVVARFTAKVTAAGVAAYGAYRVATSRATSIRRTVSTLKRTVVRTVSRAVSRAKSFFRSIFRR
ncbi:MAG: hypothetical protein ACE5J7_04525 [Candidatus Aenigmatarchaeota archaeon]